MPWVLTLSHSFSCPTLTPFHGKIVHVVGSPMTGYKHEVKHFWNSEKTRTAVSKHLLGTTAGANIVDFPIAAEMTTPPMTLTGDFNKADKFENRASRIDAPRAALPELWPNGKPSKIRDGWAKDIPGVKRCQECTTELIEDLVKQRLLNGDTAKKVVRAARGT